MDGLAKFGLPTRKWVNAWLHFTLEIYSLAANQTVFLHRNQGNAMYGTFWLKVIIGLFE